jgi:hypothetical protein
MPSWAVAYCLALLGSNYKPNGENTMRLTVDGISQEIAITSPDPCGLILNRDELPRLATALMLAWQGQDYAEVQEAIARSEGLIDGDELEDS